MTSTPKGKALLLVQRVLSLHHFFHSSIPQSLSITSKVTTMGMDGMFFFVDHIINLQAVSRVARKIHFGHRVALHKLVVDRDDLHQWIDEYHKKDYCWK